MTDLDFAHPEALWYLVLLPVAWVLWRVHVGHRAAARERFEDWTKLEGISRASTSAQETLRGLAVLGALAVLLLALAQPRAEWTQRHPVYRKQDVVLILDTSLSMRATDVAPSRIARAKEEIRNFILERGPLVDRIGLVTFSGTSVILSYLTSDPDNILFYLDFMDAVPRVSYGTNIGSALDNGLTLVAREAEATERAGLQDANQKIFLLIADGEDYGKELDDAVRAASSAGIPIYAVGIGSDHDATIPMEMPDSQYLLRDERGQLVSARFDESTLRSIAAFTGGRYYRSHSGAELAGVMRGFLEGERQVLRYEEAVERVELHPRLLVVAGVLLSLALII